MVFIKLRFKETKRRCPWAGRGRKCSPETIAWNAFSGLPAVGALEPIEEYDVFRNAETETPEERACFSMSLAPTWVEDAIGAEWATGIEGHEVSDGKEQARGECHDHGLGRQGFVVHEEGVAQQAHRREEGEGSEDVEAPSTFEGGGSVY